MNWLERKGPFVRYSDVACPQCHGNLIEFDMPVSDIIITDTFCVSERCNYNITNSVEVIGDINEMSNLQCQACFAKWYYKTDSNDKLSIFGLKL